MKHIRGVLHSMYTMEADLLLPLEETLVLIKELANVIYISSQLN